MNAKDLRRPTESEIKSGRQLNPWGKQPKQIETKDGQVHWRDWERYSARQDTKMKMGGFVGEAQYRGELQHFLPLLKLGEAVHVGKATGFGLGRYEVKRS